MMRTYEFDDAVLSPGRFRYHVLVALSVTKHLKELVKKQRGVCAIPNCPLGSLDSSAVVDHIITVKEFAYDLSRPLTEAYLRCHALDNLQAIHSKCNSDRNRKGELRKSL